jgi:hypothetical protein
MSKDKGKQDGGTATATAPQTAQQTTPTAPAGASPFTPSASDQPTNGKKKRGKLAPDGETKAQRFVRLATKRVGKVLKMLAVCENLANKSTYEFTGEQAQKIVNALTTAVDKVVQRFSGAEDKEEFFTL